MEVTTLANCIRLKGLENSYRIRMGDYRILFVSVTANGTVFFEYLVSRGEAYSKEYIDKMRNREKNK